MRSSQGSHFTITTNVPPDLSDRIVNGSISFLQPGIPAPTEEPASTRCEPISTLVGIPGPKAEALRKNCH
jgi:hypothetical protein